MLNLIMLIFVGGAFGAMCREFVMLSVPRLADGFPMDIFVANIVAAFLLGVATSLFKSNRINQYVHVMIGTGIMGGLSTFSSFVFGAVEMIESTNDETAFVVHGITASALTEKCAKAAARGVTVGNTLKILPE